MSTPGFRTRAYSLWKDIGERAMWTFVQTLISVEAFDTLFADMVANLDGRLNLPLVGSLLLSLSAAGLSALKGFVASKVGPPTAALPEPVSSDPNLPPVNPTR